MAFLYTNKQELLKILESNNLRAKKTLGQNFLINTSVLTTILEQADLQKNDYIVEVGPGLGILTQELAKHAKKVDTIELDLTLIPYLQKNFTPFKNIHLIHKDALKFLLPQSPYKVIANIPYYITSPLLNHFLWPKQEKEQRPSLLILLVQKEVAEKICASEEDQSVLSLQVQIFGKPQIVRKVPATSFFPSPQVESAILKIATYPTPLISNPELFFKIIKIAFSQRRKTLLNSLHSGLKLSKDQLSSLLLKANVEENRRPQTLKISEWENLIKMLP